MSAKESWGNWWREFLGLAGDASHSALEILTQRYVEKSQQVERFRRQAERMQYPQFREKLSAIAADQNKHVDWIGEKIRLLGGRVPDIAAVEESEKTSWQYLLEDLSNEEKFSDGLIEQAQRLREELPSVADLLERMYQDGQSHREALREMLMRSDPQSHLSL